MADDNNFIIGLKLSSPIYEPDFNEDEYAAYCRSLDVRFSKLEDFSKIYATFSLVRTGHNLYGFNLHHNNVFLADNFRADNVFMNLSIIKCS